MTTAVAIAVVLLVLSATNVWVHAGPRLSKGLGPWLGPRLSSGLVLGGVHLLTGPLAALFLLLIGRVAGLTWPQLGLGWQALPRGVLAGTLAAVAVAIVYAAGVAIPLTRDAFRDTRYRLGLRGALYLSLVAIPLGTVLFEEVAFRGVLWGLLDRSFGVQSATAVAAVIFARPGPRAHPHLGARAGNGRSPQAGPDRAGDDGVHGHRRRRLRRAAATYRQPRRTHRPALGHERPRGSGSGTCLGDDPW